MWNLVLSLVWGHIVACDPGLDEEWIFVGCAYSTQECYYSCASPGAFKAVKDEELCFLAPAEWACYCPLE